MEWLRGKISINEPVVFPEEKYQDKYLIGLKMFLRYKESLVLMKDSNYLSFLDIYKKIEHATMLDFDRANRAQHQIDDDRHCTEACHGHPGRVQNIRQYKKLQKLKFDDKFSHVKNKANITHKKHSNKKASLIYQMNF